VVTEVSFGKFYRVLIGWQNFSAIEYFRQLSKNPSKTSQENSLMERYGKSDRCLFWFYRDSPQKH
jgi:hypothetical protein